MSSAARLQMGPGRRRSREWRATDEWKKERARPFGEGLREGTDRLVERTGLNSLTHHGAIFLLYYHGVAPDRLGPRVLWLVTVASPISCSTVQYGPPGGIVGGLPSCGDRESCTP
jgi:hypothetical protein